MSQQIALAYRGKIRALVGFQHYLAFVTHHPEQQATALYRLDARQYPPILHSTPLSSSATALINQQDQLYVAGVDGQIYQGSIVTGELQVLWQVPNADSPVLALALLANQQLAILQAQQWHIVDIGQARHVQSHHLKQDATRLAASADGSYVVIGDRQGLLSTWQLQDNGWHFSAQAALHQGSVSSLCFEPHQLRFYSAADDKQLLSTHAQGELQALDKGKNSNHSGTITAILFAEQRFFTASNDASIKAWPIAGGQPSTYKQGLSALIGLTSLDYRGQKHLVAASQDSLFFMAIDSEEKPQQLSLTIRDGYTWAQQLLQQKDPKQQQTALDLLTSYDDEQALTLIHQQINKETEKNSRLKMLALLVSAKHPKANVLLESLLKDNLHDSVRLAAFESLNQRVMQGVLPDAIAPCQKALDSGHLDIGRLALQQLATLSTTHNQALVSLKNALQHNRPELRFLALSLLEQHFDAQDPSAPLLALQSTFSDLQRAGLIRLYQRQLLSNMEVQRTIVLLQDHSDALVRQTAFWVAIAAKPALAAQLHQLDTSWTRPLTDLANFKLIEQHQTPSNNTPFAEPTLTVLTDVDLTPLLQSLSSRHADICFYAAYGLALLADERAFGILLMLSQETDSQIRLGVCQALAKLPQLNGLKQLAILLNDPQAAVRDAAFSSYGQLANYTQWVKAGFASQHQDIHQRTLKLLLEKGSLPDDDNQQLLLAALNDPFAAVRKEVSKACLNRSLTGNYQQNVHLLLSSQYQDVHIEALQEWQAKCREPQAIDLLNNLLNDNFAEVRQQALQFALNNKKLFPPSKSLAYAIVSQFLDVRRAALQFLQQNIDPDYQPLLLTLLNDSERQLAIDSANLLLNGGDETVIGKMLDCPHEDIRLNVAANYAAQQGDARAWPVLFAVASRNKPEDKHLHPTWLNNSKLAIQGLSLLADVRAFELICQHINHHETGLHQVAAQALPWVSSKSQQNTLIEYLKDERLEVRAYSVLALALQGQPQALAALADSQVLQKLSAYQQFAAWSCLNSINPPTLQTLLKQNSVQLSSCLLFFSHELLLNPHQPELSSWLLALNIPHLQFIAARLLQHYHQPDYCWQLLTEELNQFSKVDKKNLLTVEELKTLAQYLVFAPHPARGRAYLLLEVLDKSTSRQAWLSHYQAFCQRYASTIDPAQLIAQHPKNDAQINRYQALAFGAYLGLIRHSQSQYHLMALNQLLKLVNDNPSFNHGVIDCLLPLLHHKQQVLRQESFSALQKLGLNFEKLGQAAITSEHSDVVKSGLNLLLANYSTEQGQTLLSRLIQTSSPILSVEGWQLLSEQQGLLVSAPLALQSFYQPLRQQAVAALAKDYADIHVQQLLLQASANDHRPTAIAATEILVRQQHPQALTQVKELLWYSVDAHEQKRLLTLLSQINHQTSAQLAVDYLDHYQRRVDINEVYDTLAKLRNPTIASTLLKRFALYPEQQPRLHKTLVTISGYDQKIVDYDDKFADKTWLDTQYPRHDLVLFDLTSTLLQQQLYKLISPLLHSLAWTKNTTADELLLSALVKVPSEIQIEVIQAIARRAKKRQGNIQGLLDSLSHKNADVQFLAAEGLAQSGHLQGNNVLLAAIDYQTNADYRQRAVLALGQSGDARALDKLLQLANDSEHFLQDVAIEAIGHLANSEQAEKILSLLIKPLTATVFSQSLVQRALNGLRWFNQSAAWQVISDYIRQEQQPLNLRCHAISLLAHWSSDTSQAILIHLLTQQQNASLVKAALLAAEHIWPPQAQQVSLVDIAVVSGYFPRLEQEKSLKKVLAYANCSNLLQIISSIYQRADNTIDQAALQALIFSLLQQTDLPPHIIDNYLSAEDERIVALAARLLARQQSAEAQSLQLLAKALQHYLSQWQTWQQSSPQQRPRFVQQAHRSQQVMPSLLWAAVAHNSDGVFIQKLLAQTEQDYFAYQQIILEALLAFPPSNFSSWLSLLNNYQQHSNPVLAQLSQQLIAQQQSTTINLQFSSLIPQLIAQANSQQLIILANNKQLEDNTRFSAIEGLARLHDPHVATSLQQLSQDQDEDIRKAAFKALRRYQRLQQKNLGIQAVGANR